MHEMRSHRDQRAISEDEIWLISESFDAAKDIIPTTAVQTGRVIAQFIKDLIHFERCENGLDQDRCSDAPAWNPDFILSKVEDIIPKPRLKMALHLGQVKIRTATSGDEFFRIVKQIETKIEKAPGHRFPINQQMFFDKVPPARPNE